MVTRALFRKLLRDLWHTRSQGLAISLVIAAGVAAIPGVARVTARVVQDVALDIPDRLEPATGRLISLPAADQPILNEPFLRRGRRPEASDEVVVSEGFALAHHFVPGDSVLA